MKTFYLCGKIMIMMLENQIREIYHYQREYYEKSDTGTPRNLLQKIDLNDKHIKIITGIRRCGKSTLLLQLLKKAGGFNFMSFEDPRLSEFEVNDFFKLEKILQEEAGNDNVYFFDEIQNVKGWENFVRVLHDKKARVILSGSYASLLSKELGTSLTGRQITYELYPFSYKEFIKHKNEKPGKKSFANYMESGGFPEYINSYNQDILLNLFNDLIYRDIVVRHGIRNAGMVKQLGVYLASNTGKEFSYNNLTKTFSLGSVNTLLAYISYFEDAYLFFTIPQFSYSLQKQAKNPKKIYGIDTGLINRLSLSFSGDKGRLLENIVFIELKRRGGNVFYFRKNKECDFVISEKGKVQQLIQVCYELNDSNLDRELGGLTEAMDELKLNKGVILTFNQNDNIIVNGKKVSVIPVWKWLLKQ